MIAQPASS